MLFMLIAIMIMYVICKNIEFHVKHKAESAVLYENLLSTRIYMQIPPSSLAHFPRN